MSGNTPDGGRRQHVAQQPRVAINHRSSICAAAVIIARHERRTAERCCSDIAQPVRMNSEQRPAIIGATNCAQQ
ncbi:hypothetical protein F511_44556 [Dorcoceras hygrometricum]|uniref:Uncharacterized protein n=1 Tax=Dorcoceras hygrometricum TaxID=472368 RepID=A0A2Z7CA25_9LAMI|nr:hypothetical protein F511_44556 [Dorcoceras hygrometricum]